MKFFKKLNDFIEKALRAITVVMMLVLVFTVFIEVFVRNVLKKPIIWSTEVAIICFIWLVFLGSAIAVRSRRHYIVELIPMHYVKTNLVFDIIADLASFALLYIMSINGIKFAKMGMIRYTTALSLPQTVMFAAIPVSGFIMASFNIEQLVKNVTRLKDIMTGKIKVEGVDILESNRAING